MDNLKYRDKLKSILKEINDGKIDYTSGEGIAALNSSIQLPSFHYIMFNEIDEDNNEILVGYCLDFDIFAFSKDLEGGEKKIFKRLAEMVIQYIAVLIKLDDIDALYDNANWGFTDGNTGDLYYKGMKNQRVKALKNSVELFMTDEYTGIEDLGKYLNGLAA